MSKKIAIDADGTIFKVTDLICTLINFKRGTNFTYKDVTSWGFWKEVGYEKEFWEVYDLMDNSDLRMALRPYDLDTIDVLKQINTLTKKSLNILTCNSEKAAESIQNWFSAWPEERTPDVKIVCIGRQTSREKLELSYDIYIDDSPHMAEMIHEFSNKKMILMNAPWNKNVKENGQVVRVHEWKDVIPTLYKMNAFEPIKYKTLLEEKEFQPVLDELDKIRERASAGYVEEDWYYK